MRNLSIGTLLVFVLCTACATQHSLQSSQQVVNASALIMNPSSSDRMELVVVGVIHHDESGHSYLVDGDNAGEEMAKGRFLDLVTYNKEIQKALSNQIDGCIQVSGKFVMYSKDILPTGSLISPIGEIQAESAMPCQAR